MSSDEEDMQEMLATMANVLQERYSSERDDEDEEGKDSCEDTQFGDDDSDREEPELALNESWHSGELDLVSSFFFRLNFY